MKEQIKSTELLDANCQKIIEKAKYFTSKDLRKKISFEDIMFALLLDTPDSIANLIGCTKEELKSALSSKTLLEIEQFKAESIKEKFAIPKDFSSFLLKSFKTESKCELKDLSQFTILKQTNLNVFIDDEEIKKKFIIFIQSHSKEYTLTENINLEYRNNVSNINNFQYEDLEVAFQKFGVNDLISTINLFNNSKSEKNIKGIICLLAPRDLNTTELLKKVISLNFGYSLESIDLSFKSAVEKIKYVKNDSVILIKGLESLDESIYDFLMAILSSGASNNKKYTNNIFILEFLDRKSVV